MSDPQAILRWYAALTAIAICLLPLVAWLGARLGAARYGLLRPLSFVLLTGVVWWPAVAAQVPFRRATLVGALVVLGIAGWVWWWRVGFDGFDLRALLAFEAAWLALFLGYAWFRGFNPDIAHTEKPMEIALLSSASRSNAAPAPDPWLAGSHINYYYFGYQMIAAGVKLSGVPPVIAFNLALATLFASCATAAGAVGVALTRAARRAWPAQLAAGALSATFLLLAGNLETARRLLRAWHATINAGWWDGVGWQASRIVVDHNVTGAPPGPRETINEFPAFSFVLGDLHPHVLTYPLLAAVLALAVGLLLGEARPSWPRLVVTGTLVGLLYASNSWDAPLGFLLVAGAAGFATRFRWRAWALAAGAVAAGAVVAAAPFILTFDPPVGVANPDVPHWLNRLPVAGTLARTFGIVTWHPTVLRELLIVHGVWLAIFTLYAGVAVYRDRAYLAGLARHRDLALVGALLSLAVAIIWAPAVIVIGWPLGLAVWLALRAEDAVGRAIAGLFAVGFLLVLVPEFFYIQDVFGDRMNTVFKLYFQAWLLLSIASAGALLRVFGTVARRWRPGIVAAVVLALVVTLPYVRLSAWDWSGQFKQRQGLNGAAFIARIAPGDAAAIAWVRANARPGDVLLEAPGCSYGEYYGVPMDRVSAFTGVPTIIGWLDHENQWRRGQSADEWSILSTLATQTAAYFDGSAPTPAQTDATFVVLGYFETTALTGCDLTNNRSATTAQQLTAAGWQLAYDDAGTQVYARPGRLAATPSVGALGAPRRASLR